MRNDVRRITDGAMIAALLGVLLVIDRQLGFLIDSFLFWIIPIPLIVYVVKYGIKNGVLLGFSVTLLSFIIATPDIVVLMAFSVLIALAYGYGTSKEWSISKTLVLTFIATVIYYLVTMVVFAKFFGYDPAQEAKEILAFFSGILEKINLGGSNVLTFIRWTNPFFAMLIMFVPFLPIAIALLQTLITHLFSSIILTRLKLAEIKVTPVFMINIDRKVGLAALIVLIITYVLPYILPNNSYDSVIILVQFMCQLIFIVSGAIYLLTIAIIKKKPVLSIVVGLSVILIPLLVLLVGIFDVFTDHRLKMLRRAANERETRSA